MPCRDFFSFCTTLKPVELKALGELSYVRHLQKGDVVYSVDDQSDALFSINRGVMEMTRCNPGEADERSFLSRGDLFGIVETLAQIPRLHTATAQETVSLQCFELRYFETICQRIPTFFRFLCEQMAVLVQRAALASGSAGEEQLSGSLANFDLITIHQMIMSSGQTGELCLLNDNGERVATFAFRNGAPRSGQFLHLTGEEAFWQLFLCDDVPGMFSFTAGAHPITDCMQAAEIDQPPHDLLLSALHSRDELHALRSLLPDRRVPLERRADFFAWPADGDENLFPLAEQIWQLMDRRRVTIDQLFRLNSVCELKIYSVVAELLRAGQIGALEEVAMAAGDS
ncbi:MAG: cyclic nucleotide-binding domain-containing protein [Verrucomicrobiota bacterium]